ncbi:MAG: aminotransferase class III-fold pyridoxal phosphate-dependent enzyme [Thermodesulfobacteriota bacterium]
MSDAKRRALDLAARHVCPDRVRTFGATGIDLVIGRREGYRLRDLDGRELLDFHLNGGVFNLGHRNPEIVAALRDALDTLDVGNHHFPSLARAELAEALVATMPGDLRYVVFSPSGGEAIDVAIKSARHATQRRTIVSIQKGYHGHTGLALAAGDDRFSRLFLSEGPREDFVQVPFNDLDAMEAALGQHAVAAVVLETIPATYGFPLPAPGYLSGVKALCERFGALYVADEVQTGLGRTGRMWGVECFGVAPDVLVTGKGLSGGLYPMSATVLTPRAAQWLEQDGWGHVSTFGGAEVGCRVAQKVLEITTRAGVLDGVQAISDRLAAGLETLRARHPDWLLEIRRQGVVMGLRFAHERGGQLMTRALHDAGLWAMFAGFDTSVLQFKAGLLIDAADCDEALGRFEDGMRRCIAMLGR